MSAQSTTGTPRKGANGGASPLPTTPARMAKVISYWEQIFEEQAVVPSVSEPDGNRPDAGADDPASTARAVFGVRERTLSFGKVVYTAIGSVGMEDVFVLQILARFQPL